MIDTVIYKKDLRPKKRGQWNDIKGYSGCYIFTYKNEIQYVGRSSNLYIRLVSHFSDGGICNAFKWDTISFILCENHKEIERYLINKLQPYFNGFVSSKIHRK